MTYKSYAPRYRAGDLGMRFAYSAPYERPIDVDLSNPDPLMNEKAASAQQKATQERKRGHFDKAVKRLEQAIAQFPDELDLVLDAVDACLEGGEVMQATNFLKVAQEKFPKEKDRVAQFVRDKLLAVHDPALARYVVENAVKRRDLDSALEHLEQIPDHVARDLLARTKTKKQSLKSASHGGYSLRAEMFTNDLLSALLSIRLGNTKEAMAAMVEMIDEKPAESPMLTPFLAGLESKNPKVGRIRFANACALWAGGNEVDAITRFVETARLDPTAVQMCIDRLQGLRDKTKYRPKVERALAELLLIKGDFDATAILLRAYLSEHKEAGREVIMLLKPFIDPAHVVNECVWVALEAALTLEQSNATMEILRPLHTSGKCTPEIYARMQEKTKENFYAIDIMLFHASLALELKDFPRAVEVLEAIVTKSPQDVHMVLGLADKHRSAHPGLEELCRKHMQVEPTESIAEEGDFQNFDNNEFSFEASKADGIERSSSSRGPSAPKAPAAKPSSRFADERTKPVEKQSFTESREFSFDDDGTPASEKADPAENAGEETDTDGFDIAHEMRLSTPGDARPAPKAPAFASSGATSGAGNGPSQSRPALKLRPAVETGTTESHVTNVARRLGEVGAAAFFHIDGDDEPVNEPAVARDEAPPPPPAPAARAPIDAMSYASAPVAPTPTPAAPAPAAKVSVPEISIVEETPAPEIVIEPEVVVEPEVEATAPTATIAPTPAPAPAPAAPTPTLMERIERAVEEHRADELHDLLAFEPKDDAERFAQRFYEAEYHIMCNRPLPALEVLAKLDMPSLSDEQKQRVWFKIAVCQRSMNDFAGANETLKRLVATFPGHAEYERLERRNYEQFVGDQANDVPILQKTTSLD